MKVEKTVRIAAQKARTETRVKVMCDIPGCKHEVIQGNYGYGGGKCGMCSRDACKEHRTWDHHDPSDYPSKYCVICWALMEKYRPIRLKIMEDYEKKEDALDRKIKKESLSSTLEEVRGK